MAEKYYKLLNDDGSTTFGHGVWPLAKGKRPGKWLPKVKGDLIECRNGYHVLTADQLIYWHGQNLWEIEVKGEATFWDNKNGVRQARTIKRIENWNSETLRLWAADCAERVLHIFENVYPNDDRPRKAIEAARTNNNAAAWAADAAARAAAAAWAADAAARAADAAAADAARAIEHKWQSAKLRQYLGI